MNNPCVEQAGFAVSSHPESGCLASIIIVNYNYGHFLRAAVDGALAQTYALCEVIVVDDGSTDNSPDLIRSYGESVKLVEKVNGGQASAFNAGFRASRGEIIFFVDADDALKPHAVESVVKLWRNGIAKVHFPLELMTAEGDATGVIVPRAPLAQGCVVDDLKARGYYVSSPTTGNAFSRSVLEKIMPMPEVGWRDGADSYLVHLAPFFGDVVSSASALALYRVHTGSVSNTTGGSSMNLQKFRNQLAMDLRLKRMLNDWAADHSVQLSSDAVFGSWPHIKMRLASLKMAGKAHFFEDDSLLALLRQSWKIIWRSKELNFFIRVAFTVWTVAVAFMPRALATPLVRFAFSPISRQIL